MTLFKLNRFNDMFSFTMFVKNKPDVNINGLLGQVFLMGNKIICLIITNKKYLWIMEVVYLVLKGRLGNALFVF